eukprot:SAG11_NODE_3829_length_2187_cov_1.302857_1_plen_46_part_10
MAVAPAAVASQPATAAASLADNFMSELEPEPEPVSELEPQPQPQPQ